ncbi:MAG: STAS domain-containing protein [Bacteroidaceae bacterium]|nr:STAS domain-containing protein [Bacteroidaceae bacterium]
MLTEITKQENLTIITLNGRLDTPSTPEVEEKVFPLMKDETVREVRIDCSELAYISSSGLRIFITLQKHFMKIGGKLVIANITPSVKSVFDMTGFSNIFKIVED